jgi:hypothetical protein
MLFILILGYGYVLLSAHSDILNCGEMAAGVLWIRALNAQQKV